MADNRPVSPESQEQLHLAVEAANVGTWDYDTRTGRIEWSARCREIFGVGPDDELDYAFFGTLLHPDDRQRVDEEVETAVRGSGLFESQYRIVRPDGELRWIQSRGRMLFDGDGAPGRLIGAVVDITRQKNIEEELRRSDARTRAVIDGAGVGIVLVTPDGRPLVANAAACEFLGYTAEELAALTPAEITHPDDIAADFALFQELLAGTRSRYSIEKRYIHKSGAIVWARLTISLAGDYAVAVVEDITERRKAAEELRRAHERYELASRATNDVIWDWDAAAGTIIWNDALRTTFGYDPDSIDNRLLWWEEHLHPADRDRAAGSINQAIDSGASSWTGEYRFERADGTYAVVLDRGYISRAPDGRPLRMIGAMLDVTDRKRGERTAAFMAEASARLASSLDYRSTLEQVADLAVPSIADWCVFDLCGEDGRYERLAIAHSDRAKAPRIRDIYVAVHRAIDGGQPVLFEHVNDEILERVARTPDDAQTLRELGIRSAIIVPIAVANAAPMGALTLAMSDSRRAFDERDRKTAEDLARRAAMAIEHARLYEAAQQANRAKDEFLATLSHELRTPLTAILGWAGLLEDPSLDPETRRLGMETIHRSAIAQARLVDDVLDLSRVIAGKMRLDVQSVSIAGLVRASVDAVRLAAAAKEIRVIATEADAGEIIGDANRLQQVVWNLLANAIKFTPQGGRVEVNVETMPSSVRLTVSDSGSGIAPEFLPHVFEPFRQADAATTRIHGGLGLGLAIVRYIVEAHGGTVSAHSDGPGRGALFTVEFPRVAADRAQPRPPLQTAASPDLKGVRVLFVDDQEDARHLARVILSRAGADTAIASCVSEALAELVRSTPDVVVTDIAMPVEDGYALLRELRSADSRAGRRTPAIAATAYGSPEDRARALAAGFDAYIKKPMQADALTAAIAEVLRSVRTPTATPPAAP
jgi:PAS domain S-box-containing protein